MLGWDWKNMLRSGDMAVFSKQTQTISRRKRETKGFSFHCLLLYVLQLC